MRTCGDQSPMQLWILGFMSRPEEDPSAVLGLGTFPSPVAREMSGSGEGKGWS